MSNYPCKINIEEGTGCAPEPDEMCGESSQSLSDCQAACSALMSSSGCYDPCVMDCCIMGNSDPDYLEGHMMGCHVDECASGIPGPCTTYEAEDVTTLAESTWPCNSPQCGKMYLEPRPGQALQYLIEGGDNGYFGDGYTGTGYYFATYKGYEHRFLEWKLPLAEATMATVTFRYWHTRYTWKAASAREANVIVNGADVKVNGADGFVWTAENPDSPLGWRNSSSVTFPLNTGDNTVRLKVGKDPEWHGRTGIDSMTVCVLAPCAPQPPSPPMYPPPNTVSPPGS